MRHAASSILARVAALTPIGRAYARATQGGSTDFSAHALEALDISADVSDEDQARVPSTGATLIVGNHPFGAIDGLLLLSIVSRVRGDVKLVGNDLLRHIPGLASSLLAVDVFGRAGSVRQNATALRQARRWLEQGGCVVMFPAGEVAHERDLDGAPKDSAWQRSAAALATRAGADVLPVYVAGGNSRLFRVAGRLHPLLRTALLPREMWAKRGTTVSVRIGEKVDASTLLRLPDAAGRTAFLRARVDALASRPRHARTTESAHAPVAARGIAEEIERNIEALQPQTLLDSGAYQVFCARARDLPALLPEIGRLREVAFRQAGEGTGLPRDLDRFDETYEHLFVWDRLRKEVAGAYRLGATDVVAAGGRVDGLYTRTLFDYDAALIDEIGPALELGRSFVHPAYQRDFSPLLLLWRGISRVVARSGRYRRLFGVVSVSDRYQTTSRQLLLKFLQTTRFDADLGRLVRAKNPPPPARAALVETAIVSSLDDLSSLIRRLEPDGKDVPVLLRQYLKLNARLLGFTIDTTFSSVLDGLVVVDLADVAPAILTRYMGRDEARAFLAALPRSAREASNHEGNEAS